jgi:2-(1,2-epoxy-1,2-dihydrophenyl)acetyl-CoA isomerase
MTEAFETIDYVLEEGLAQITLSRPDRLNALSVSLIEELSAALDRALKEGARAVLLTGQGRAFSAGLDLVDAGRRQAAGQNENILDEYFAPLALKFAELAIPVVAAVNGGAIGGGCAIALAADIVVAGESAYFKAPFVNLGLVPDTGATWLIASSIGRARAMAMLLLGERMTAQDALSAGLISRVVLDADLAAEAIRLARRLAQGPTIALGLIRHQVNRAVTMTLPEVLRLESEHQQMAGQTADVGESLCAFLEKRQPNFKGT